MLIESRILSLPSGLGLRIGSAEEKDARSVMELRLLTSGQTHFMVRYPEECRTNEDDMREVLRKTALSPTDFSVTAFDGDRVVGDLGVTQVRGLEKMRHRASLGVAILSEYCSRGLGGAMLDIAAEQARKNGFEQLELGVFSDNARAIHLYAKHGFIQCGIIPNAFKLRDGSYRNEILMIKRL